jgi:hypothetical protein
LVEHQGDSHELTRSGEGMERDYRSPLTVHERRWWSSLLAPVYLQLLEGLRRVTEGHSGAAICHECGQPFLTLDARRSSFCNDRERFRFTQRERRKRLAAPPPNVPRGMLR